MRKWVAVLSVLSLLGAVAPRVDADTDVHAEAHKAKEGIKDAGRSIGPAFKKLGHQIGDGVKSSVHSIKSKLHHSAQKPADKPPK